MEQSFIFNIQESIETDLSNYPEFKFIPIYKYLKKSNNKIIRFLNRFLYPLRLNRVT